MTTAAEMVDTRIAALNASLEAITDPDELDVVADNMDAFSDRYLTAAQASQLTDTAANVRARAQGLRPVVLAPDGLSIPTTIPAANVTTE